jgi:hypothetical protein
MVKPWRGLSIYDQASAKSNETTSIHHCVPSLAKSPLPPFVNGGAQTARGFVGADHVYESYDSPFALSISDIVNFKLSVESSAHPKPAQDVLRQR